MATPSPACLATGSGMVAMVTGIQSVEAGTVIAVLTLLDRQL